MSFRWKQKVLRATGGGIDEDGMVVDPSYNEITIMATVQPLNTHEQSQYTKANPNGEFTANIVKIYSDEPLIPSKQATEQNGNKWADIVPWDDKYYKVISCNAYQAKVISHYKSVAQEVSFDGVINAEDVPEGLDSR